MIPDIININVGSGKQGIVAEDKNLKKHIGYGVPLNQYGDVGNNQQTRCLALWKVFWSIDSML